MNKYIKFVAVALIVSFVGANSVSAIGYGDEGGGSSGGGGGSSSGRTDSRRDAVITTSGRVLGASTYTFQSRLSITMSGDAVKELQERLRAEGFFTFPTSTGYFGPITEAAVKAYQTAKGIVPASGIVGPLTRAELNK